MKTCDWICWIALAVGLIFVNVMAHVQSKAAHSADAEWRRHCLAHGGPARPGGRQPCTPVREDGRYATARN